MASPGIKSLLVVLGLITTGCCQQQIVVPNPIATNQPFTVYCDSSSVTLPSGVTGLFRLQIFRNVSTEPSGTRVAYYSAYAPPGSSPSGFNNPRGRDWNFTFSGNTGDSLTMQIEWLVRDTKCEDAGTYRCRVEYYPPGSYDPAIIENSINVTAVGSCQPPIAVPSPITANQPFTVYCDSNRVALPSGVTGLFRLQIFRNVSTEPSGTPIAYYSAYAPPGACTSGFNNPRDRDWIFIFSGNTANSLSMKIEWLVRDTKCEDAGTYRCHVDYYPPGSGDPALIDNSINVTAVGSCQQPIAVPSLITANQPFTVYCDASRVALPSGVTGLVRLQIFRNVSTEPSSTAVAYYSVYAPPGLSTSGFYNPRGRDWRFTFTGNNVTTMGALANRNSMKIEWTVWDTKDEDAGTYHCHVEYYIPGSSDAAASDGFINVQATD